MFLFPGGLFGAGGPRRGRMLGGFVGSLLQGFENRRAGLSDRALAGGGEAVLPFFTELYEKDIPPEGGRGGALKVAAIDSGWPR